MENLVQNEFVYIYSDIKQGFADNTIESSIRFISPKLDLFP